MTTYYVFGHLDVTAEEFAAHYAPRIEQALAAGAAFVVGDARGCDARAQEMLWAAGCTRVTVFHMFEAPRHNPGFAVRGGFATDDARDVAMTAASDQDIGWVRPGREQSGTARSLARRAAAAAPTWVPVGKAAELADGDLVAVEVAGREVVIYRDGERIGCVQRKCLHQGGDLSQGIISRHHIVCPVHGWRFSTATGVHAESAETCLAVFEVRIVDGTIEVDPTPRRHGRAP